MSRGAGLEGARRVLLLGPGGPALRGLRWARAAGLETVALVGRGLADPPWADAVDDVVDVPVDADGQPQVDAVVDAALDAGCDLVLAGWGPLRAAARLAEGLIAAGVGWAGPSGRALGRIADPAALATRAAELGLPTLPGGGPWRDAGAAQAALRDLGPPVHVIGGERWLCRSADGAAAAVARALAVGPVRVERHVDQARVWEVPVLADGRGGARALAPLDLSGRGPGGRLWVEGPAAGAPPPPLLEAWAAALTSALGLRGLAALRFIQGPDGRCALLRVRAGLAPWHGLTEALHGIDLVDAQVRLALGGELPGALPPAAGAAVQAGLRAAAAGVAGAAPDDGLRWDLEAAPGEAVAAGAPAAALTAVGPTRGAALVRLRVALSADVLPGLRIDDAPLRRLLDAPALWRGPMDRDAVAACLHGGARIAQPPGEG